MLSFVMHSEKAQRERERELEAEGLMRVLMIEAWWLKICAGNAKIISSEPAIYTVTGRMLSSAP